VKITGYRTFVVGTPWRNLTYLILETDEGFTGVGEARVLGKTHTVLEFLKDTQRHFLGFDPFDVEALYQRFTLLDYGSPGEVVMTGLALVEMACWDIMGKKANLPVYQMIGGKVHHRIPAYANGWYTGERTPEAFAEAAQKVVDRGYLGLKFDPFGNGNLELSRKEFHKSIAIIEAVHSVTGDDVQMFIEMHGRFAPHQAVEIAKAIEKFRPGWIEEPCRAEDVPALRYVMDHTDIPIATGERLYHAQQYRDLLSNRLTHIIQPDLNQCGGLLETKKICSTAETFSIMAAPHNVGGIITTVATLHMLVGLRNAKVLEHFNDFVDSDVKLCGSPYPEVVDGYFSVPSGPGWGVTLNEDMLTEAHARHGETIILDPGLNMFVNEEWSRRSR
jgi:galactonate dehydratase